MLALPVLRVIEGATEPTTVKVEQETPLVQAADEVATLCSAPVPEPYRRLPEVKEVAPVPPLATATVVPFHTPLETVPR